jgi:predicted HNH restriction endonuclease
VRNEGLLKISKVLVKYAKYRNVIEYGQLCREIGLDIPPITLKDPLGEISIRCIKNGHPPLSAIVVNKDTRLPGEGLFTYVAPNMGYFNLKFSEYENFFEEQKRRIFNHDDWDSFLDSFVANNQQENKKVSNAHSSKESILKSDQNSGEFDKIAFRKDLNNYKYVIGDETAYYLITVKRFFDTQQKGPFKYSILLLENHNLIKKFSISHETSKQLLTPAKIKGMKILFEHAPFVGLNDISMIHYKPDRPNGTLWQKEPSASIKALYTKYEPALLKYVVINDIEAELAQEDTFYMEGAAKQYYGTRYERNAKNRFLAIKKYGATCQVCGFNFEQNYGARGKDFIEVHHVKPLYTLNQEVMINPENELVPLCSNCHRMIHRKKDDVLSVEQLKAMLRK